MFSTFVQRFLIIALVGLVITSFARTANAGIWINSPTCREPWT
jgi:hypothetical protein